MTWILSHLPGHVSTIWLLLPCIAIQMRVSPLQGVWDIIAQARKAKCPDAFQLYAALVKAAAAAMSPTDARSDAACAMSLLI